MILLRFLLLPVSILYGLAMFLRRRSSPLWIKSVRVGCPVVSVGNLTTGGTGKTPFVLALAALLKKRGKKVAIVSRAYRARVVAPTKVNAVNPGEFGDEPCLLFQAGLSVWVGKEKWRICQAAVAQEKPDLVIVDDGLQHLKLHRDFEILVQDMSVPWWHQIPLPTGFAREPSFGLPKLDAVVVTKGDLQASRFLGSSTSMKLKMNYRVGSITDLESDSEISLVGKRVYLVSGIGNPNSFESLVRAEGVAEIVGHSRYPDHYHYSDSDIRNIEARAHDSQWILTTAKDAIKIKGRFRRPVGVLNVRVEIENLEQLVDELIT